MFAVIRHTFDQDVERRYQSVGEWKHVVWIFETEAEAVEHAIRLLDHPLLKNEHSMNYAIETLMTGKFYSIGRESVAIAEVMNAVDIREVEDGEFIH